MQVPIPTPTSSVWNCNSLDVRAFTQAGALITQDTAVSALSRLSDAAQQADWGQVRWRIQGEVRPALGDGKSSHWLHLTAQASVGLTCQRCLAGVATPLVVDRWFRFVATESQAALEDDDCEEDVLSWEPRPDAVLLLEDELLMAMPLVPMHEKCPEPVAMSSGALEAMTDDLPHPFAALAQLKSKG